MVNYVPCTRVSDHGVYVTQEFREICLGQKMAPMRDGKTQAQKQRHEKAMHFVVARFELALQAAGLCDQPDHVLKHLLQRDCAVSCKICA